MDAYRAGFLASANGKTADDNPHVNDTRKSTEWARGWVAHKKLRGESFEDPIQGAYQLVNRNIWTEGRLAAANGKTAEENPYKLDSEQHWSWHLGWRDLKEYRRQKYREPFIDPFPAFSDAAPDGGAMHETIETTKYGNVRRMKSSAILSLAIFSFIGSLIALSLNYAVLAGILGLLVAPTLLLYPMFRFLFGGKGGAVPMAAAFVAQNVLKYKMLKWLEKREKR